jgi:uncharacterized membrane protein
MPRRYDVGARHEHRIPVLGAVVVALALYLLIPATVQVVPAWVVPTIGGLLLVPLVVLNPRRFSRETIWSRRLSIVLATFLTVANQVTVVFTISQLLNGHEKGTAVLLTAAQVWLTNVIAFSLVYWELDRGGPVARRDNKRWNTEERDFRFPQNDGGTADPEWRPVFLDYAYFALTNMMAFSPTDVMPMTVRAKMLMAYQSLTGFVLLALVVSRAVNILT